MQSKAREALSSIGRALPYVSMPDLVVINAGELVTCSGSGADDQQRLGVIEDGAMTVDGGKVSWIGTMREFRRRSPGRAKRTIDAEGDLVTPGFVDPHTHIAFAGSREDELERKTRGETYVSILATGGGIQRTLRDTREASVRKIASESMPRLAQLAANGVSTVEIKTGYGQSAREELKMLQAIRALQRTSPMDIVPTLLGLHATPPEQKDAKEYVDYAVREMLPAVAASKVRPEFSDCFCEEGIFSQKDCARYLRASRDLGLGLKVHADEFTDSGGAALAADLGCVSADHLGRSNMEGLEAMAKEGVVAVLLPGTSLYSSIPFADAGRITKAGCTIALGTDLSPNSWVESPQLVMALACTGLRMTPAQALLGCTVNAARALSRADRGAIRVGSDADFVVHAVPGYRYLPYRVGGRYVRGTFKRGVEIASGAG
jgi:imidazolonepropionase